MQHDSSTAQQVHRTTEWRRRKAEEARQAAEEVAASRPHLVAALVARLGGKLDPIALADVERVVDLTLLASHQRSELAAGRAKLGDVVKLEGTLARALKRLGLPEPGAVANRRVPLRERLRDGGTG